MSYFVENLKKNDIIIFMRRVLSLFILLTAVMFFQIAKADDFENVQLQIRDYDGIELPAGTFIPIVNVQEISTEHCPVGYKVKFISTNDLFMHESKIIPKDTEFYGYIEKLNEPVIGSNAAMKIKITKMLFADGFEVPLRAYIYTNNDNTIGGDISAPVRWEKYPHYQTKFRKVTLRMRPSMERKMGEHTVVRTGAEGLIILTDTAWITHTLTN